MAHNNTHTTAPGVQLLLWKLTKNSKYKDDASNFVGGAIGKGQTPKGLAYWDQWGRSVLFIEKSLPCGLCHVLICLIRLNWIGLDWMVD